MSRVDGDRDQDGSIPGPSGLIDPIDAVLALVLIVVSGFLYVETGNFPEPPLFLGDNVLPDEFPRMLLWIIVLLSLALPFEHLLERKRHPLIRKSRRAPIGVTTFATIALMVAILVFAETLGMVLAIFVSSLALPVLWGERRWWLLIGYAIGFTALVTYVFAVLLRVYFEPGLLGITVR